MAGVLDVIVKERKLCLVGMRNKARVVLPGEGEDSSSAIGRRSRLDKRVALAT